MSPVMLGFTGALAAGLMTSVGAVPVLFGRAPSRATRDMFLGFAAGVMLAASFFSLIIPAIDAAAESFGDGAIPAGIACLGILSGMIAVHLMN
jgi:ZIP family zinc transporter